MIVQPYLCMTSLEAIENSVYLQQRSQEFVLEHRRRGVELIMPSRGSGSAPAQDLWPRTKIKHHLTVANDLTKIGPANGNAPNCGSALRRDATAMIASCSTIWTDHMALVLTESSCLRYGGRSFEALLGSQAGTAGMAGWVARVRQRGVYCTSLSQSWRAFLHKRGPRLASASGRTGGEHSGTIQDMCLGLRGVASAARKKLSCRLPKYAITVPWRHPASVSLQERKP